MTMTFTQLMEIGQESNKRQQLVDEYLQSKHMLQQAEADVDAAADRLKALGCGVHNGTTGSATITQVAGRKTTDWKNLAATVGISEELIATFTKTGESTVRITVGAIK